MNVRDLKQLLKRIPEGMSKYEFNELEVLFPFENGEFVSPCAVDSGLVDLGPCSGCEQDIIDGVIEPHEACINNAMLLAPCGFFDETDITPKTNTDATE